MFRGDFTSNTKHPEEKNNQKNFEGEIGAKNRRLKLVSMVFSGNKRGGGERETLEEDMERLKRLHNFDLPYLKWGNQKLLRCMKVDSNGDVPVVDRNHSSEFVSGGSGGGSVIGTRRRDSEFEKRFKPSDSYKGFSSEKFPARINVAGDGEIEATREKLMFDFQKEVGEMKNAILRERLVDPPPPAATTTTSFNSPAERPWNLRTRRGEVWKPNSSPVKSNNGNGDVNATTSGEKNDKKEIPKLSVSISRRELEEDFTAMTGRRLPRKPKKRPRIVQKQLDTLFPGLWLSEITADLYKVPDEAETGKR